MPNQTLYDNFSQVRQYIDQEKPDLSSYVTKTELSNCGYLTSVPSEYITQQELSGNSYATTTYVADYVAEHGGGGSTVIDEDIIPKENNTYTLGDATYYYAKAYTNCVAGGTGIWMNINGNNRHYFGNSVLRCSTNNYANLGTSDYYWKATYTSRVDLNTNIALTSDGSGLFITTAGNLKFSFDTDSFHPYGSTYSGALDLGSSTRTWRSTYTSDLYSTNIILSYGYNWIKNVSNTQIDFGVNQYNRAKLTNTEFCPSVNNGIKLGTSTNQWNRTYTGYLYLNGTDINEIFTTYSYITNNYLPLTGGTLTGDLTISNTYVLTLGTERPWQIYETGTGAGAYIVMKGGSNKKFYIADYYNNPIIENLSNNSSSNYVKIHTNITYTNNILPNTNNYYKLGNNNYQWSTTYTQSLYLNGNNIINTINGIFSYDSSTGTLSITTIS